MIFMKGDLELISLKERFFEDAFEKLKSQANSPIKIIKNIDDNAYKVDFYSDFNSLRVLNLLV